MRGTTYSFVAKYSAGAVALLSVALISHFEPIDSCALRSKRPRLPALLNKILGFIGIIYLIFVCILLLSIYHEQVSVHQKKVNILLENS